MMKPVAILCAQRGSIYDGSPGCEIYDRHRDARTFRGGMPVVAHPPCRLWGRLRGQARSHDEAAERALGVFCADMVREHGGVLEHPATSTLFRAALLPEPGCFDRWGFTIGVLQSWWGHRAEKHTWLYIVGIQPADLAPFPVIMSGEYWPVVRMGRKEREATPETLATWLIETARKCGQLTQANMAERNQVAGDLANVIQGEFLLSA